MNVYSHGARMASSVWTSPSPPASTAMAQAGRRWQRSLYPWLLEFGLQQSEADPSVFYMRTTPGAHRHKDASIAADVLVKNYLLR